MIFTLSKSPAILTGALAFCPDTTQTPATTTETVAAQEINARFMSELLEIQLFRRHATLGNLSDDAQDAVRELDVFRRAALVTVDLGGAGACVHFLPHVRGEVLTRGAVPLE